MVTGYVLITSESSKEQKVYKELLKIDEVTEATPLFGEYDIIAKIEGADYLTIGQIVVDKIRRIKHVADTKTLTCLP